MKNSVYAPHTLINILRGTLHAFFNRVEKSGKWLLLLFLCSFFGILGVHRFAVKRWGTAILYMLTLGLFGIGVLVDLIALLSGKFRDRDKKAVSSGFTAGQRFTLFCLFFLGIQWLTLNFGSIPFVGDIQLMIQGLWDQLMEKLGAAGSGSEGLMQRVAGILQRILDMIDNL